ncbi:hypothetical protein ACLOJK_007664 [Asimina triloba]
MSMDRWEQSRDADGVARVEATLRIGWDTDGTAGSEAALWSGQDADGAAGLKEALRISGEADRAGMSMELREQRQPCGQVKIPMEQQGVAGVSRAEATLWTGRDADRAAKAEATLWTSRDANGVARADVTLSTGQDANGVAGEEKTVHRHSSSRPPPEFGAVLAARVLQSDIKAMFLNIRILKMVSK